jgi:peroxiredoxin
VALDVGVQAPEFTLRDQARNPISLSEFRGRKSVVVFMPFALSGVCTTEVCEIRDNLPGLAALDANVVVISTDSHHSNRTWATSEGIDFPVLSDFWPHGAVAMAYDAFDDRIGCPRRTTYVLDEQGVIRAVFTTESIGIARKFEDYVAALEAI